jgi:hypothetical protein
MSTEVGPSQLQARKRQVSGWPDRKWRSERFELQTPGCEVRGSQVRALPLLPMKSITYGGMFGQMLPRKTRPVAGR